MLYIWTAYGVDTLFVRDVTCVLVSPVSDVDFRNTTLSNTSGQVCSVQRADRDFQRQVTRCHTLSQPNLMKRRHNRVVFAKINELKNCGTSADAQRKLKLTFT